MYVDLQRIGDNAGYEHTGGLNPVKRRLDAQLKVYDGKWISQARISMLMRSIFFLIRTSKPTPVKALQERFDENLQKAFSLEPPPQGETERTTVWLGDDAKIETVTLPVDEHAKHWVQTVIKAVSADSGIPAFRLGAQEDPTYSNSREYQEDYIRGTISAIGREIASGITKQLTAYFPDGGGRLNIVNRDLKSYDMPGMDARIKMSVNRANTIRILVQSGVLVEEAIRMVADWAELDGEMSE